MGIEDGADVSGNAGTHVDAGNVSLGVLLEMELAALPRDGGEDCGTGGSEAGMGIADDERESVKATGLERGEKGSPVGLCLAEGDTDAQDGAFAVRANSGGNEHGAVEQLATLSDFFVSGIQDHVGAGTQWAFTPDLEFRIKLGGTIADLGGTHRVAAEFLDDFGNFAGGDALDIHFSQGKKESLFAAGTFFQGTGIKMDTITDLGNAQFDGADSGGQSFGFEAIGSTKSLVAALVRAGLEDGTTLLDHGLVNKEAKAFGESRGSFVSEELQNVVEKIRINLVGHVCVFVGCVW